MEKHLFSDTDTDYSTTDISWLRESSRKCKPNVTKYSRQAPIKPKAVSPHTSCTYLHLNQMFIYLTFAFKVISILVFTDETFELHTSSKKPVKPSAKSSKVRSFLVVFLSRTFKILIYLCAS